MTKCNKLKSELIHIDVTRISVNSNISLVLTQTGTLAWVNRS